MKNEPLYHGSRGGINGPIKPISRERCDFGRGFYMGEYPEQVKGLVIEDAMPMFYALEFKLSEIPDDKILVLDGMAWVYAVLACRKNVPEFSQLNIAKEIKKAIDDADVVIGPIADDRMNEAVKQFTNGALSDAGLLECLKHVDYGYQYVAKTDFACSKIEIISERDIYENEAEAIREYTKKKRAEGKNVVKQAIRDYRKEGRFLDEIIRDELEQQNKKNSPDLNDSVNNVEDWDEDWDGKR